MKLIHWERYFEKHERDGRLPAKLLEEAPGILTWAVRGAMEWYAQGLADPATVSEASAQYRAGSDILQGFLPGKYELSDDDAHKVAGKALWDDFRTWAEDENLRDLQGWSQRAFYGALKERGAHQKKTNQGQMFVGIKRAPRVHAAPEEAPSKSIRADEPGQAVSSSTPISGPDLDAL